MKMSFIFSNFKLIVSLAVIIAAVVYHDKLNSCYNTYIKIPEMENIPSLYSTAQLAQYDGVKQNKLYLAVLGVVFDVTTGKRHYEKGAPYHYFIGKDGSRAFVTGDFKDETDRKDHVLDLPCNDLFSLMKWRSTFGEKYIEVGTLIGRFFDNYGEKTAYSKEFEEKIEKCEIEKIEAKKENEKYPPCNMAWNEEEGTKVWCSKSSGGVKRSWVGVPRQMFTPGVQKPRCVCVNDVEIQSLGNIKEYDNCPTSEECFIKSND